MSREGSRLSVRTAIPRTLLLIVGALVLFVPSCAICAGMLLSIPDQTAQMSLPVFFFMGLLTLPVFVIFLAGVVLFGGALVFFVGRLLLFWRPILEVDSSGILDRASALSVGFLRWEEIKDVRPSNIGGQTFISIQPKDERQILARQNPLKRLLMRLNRRYFTKTIANVPMNVLAITEEELLTEIQPHLHSPASDKLQKILDRRRAAAENDGHSTVSSRSSKSAPSRSTPSNVALRIVGLMALLVVRGVLALIYIMASSMPVLFGALLAWNGMSPGTERDASEAHPVAGAILIVAGVLVFVFFPRLCKKITGIEPLSRGF